MRREKDITAAAVLLLFRKGLFRLGYQKSYLVILDSGITGTQEICSM